jgi:DNA-binding MarR family transcriptional regulator
LEEQSQTVYTEAIHLFLSAYRYIRTSGRRMHEEGIGGRKVATLRYLEEAGPLTVGQVRDYLYLSDSSTSELIARLEEKGYVERHRSARDNRVVIVSVTPAGAEVIDGKPLSGMPLLRERLRSLPADRLARIRDAMQDIVHLLEIQDDC